MPALHLSALFLFQDAAASASDVHLIMIAVWIIAILLLLVILGVAIGALIAVSKISKIAANAEKKAQPLISKGQEIAGHVNEIVSDLKPKIAAVSSDLQPKIAAVTSDLQPKIASISGDVTRISADAARISALVRSKVEEFGPTVSHVNETVQGFTETAKDANVKAKGQVERVNHLVSDALTTTQQVSKQIQHGIKVPVEKIATWVTAAKLSIEHLSDRFPFLKHTPPSQRPGPGPVPVPGRTATVSTATTSYGSGPTPIKRDPPPVG